MDKEVSPATSRRRYSIPLCEGISQDIEMAKRIPASFKGRRNSAGFGNDNAAFLMDEDLEPPEDKTKTIQIKYEIQPKEGRESRRNLHLSNIRAILKMYTSNDGGNTITKDQALVLFSDTKFIGLLFSLFDVENVGALSQDLWFSSMRSNSSSFQSDDRVKDLVDLLEAVTYLVCREEPISLDHFQKIWTNRGVAEKVTTCFSSDEVLSEMDLMDFIMKLTACYVNQSTLKKEDIDYLATVFRDNIGKGEEFTLNQFKKIVPSKNDFFVERVFQIFDKDKSGTVSLSEFLETMHQFSKLGEDEKINFLFMVYDLNGSGEIDEDEMRQMMKACMKESGLTFEEKEVTQLSNAFFQDAVKEGRDRITAEDLKLQLKKYNGLLESMNISITKWLIPAKPKSSGTTSQTIWPNRPKILTRLYWENNFSFAFFMLIITLFNVLLFIQRAYYFKDFANLSGSKPNPFYMISRGFGRILLFNSILILVLVLRYSLTFLRSLGLGSYLPVDHNIFIHKVIGWIIFGSAWIHAVMHFSNFAINVQPNPVKFLQLTEEYWKPHTNDNSTLGYLTKIGYNLPDGCVLVKSREEYNTTFVFPNGTQEYNTTLLDHCPEGDANSDLLVCQACPEGSEWSYFHIILTNQPGVFGFPGGMANPSGVALLAIITVMTICSLPFIRRSGNFKVFYFSHKLYLLFWGLLFLHAPEWYKWFLAPGIIWAAEKLYRRITSLLGRGKTTIQDGIILPSKVTNLVIKRSHGFNFTPGDWVFIKVPKLTKYEWHPFTISSAPEVKDTFTLHIRGVGSWTNKLHAHFQEVNKESKLRTLLSSPIEMEIKARSHSGIADIERESTNEPLEILIDGPFGSPSSDIYRAEHAVLIATGIGVTPYASILQSIMHRYRMIKTKCPNCDHRFTEDLSKTMENLKKVDFIWVNRDQKSFEWFVKLLSQLEIEQEEQAGGLDKFLEMHMYITSALQKTDMKAVGLQIALDLIYQKEKRDLVTGLKSRTNAGRPNWNKVFTKIREQNKGRVTVFYCGNPTVARMVREKCAQFGFAFKKEVF